MSPTRLGTSRSAVNFQATLTAAHTSTMEPPAKKSLLYTRTGDNGTTALYTGERHSKSHPRFEALGALDELNAHLGLARDIHQPDDANERHVCEAIGRVQALLIDVGSHVATPRHSSAHSKVERTTFPVVHVAWLETEIDRIDASLPVLREFILPGGGAMASQLHVCRAVCRRAERNLVALSTDSVDASVMQFANRLSDYLFACARLVSQPTQERRYKRVRE